VQITAPPPDIRVPLDEIELYDPAGYQGSCRHATWRTLRHEAPVWWHQRPGGQGFWCVTRYADCTRVIKDHRAFSSEGGTMLDSVGAGDPAGGRTISLADPPRHTPMRLSAMRHFSHQAVQAAAPSLAVSVADMLAPMRDGPVDFARLVRRLPMLIAGPVLGIPAENWDDIAFWTIAGLAPEDETYLAEAGSTQVARRAHHELFARFSPLIAQRRASPRADLISALVALHAADPEPELTVLLNCYSFMAGANTTTPYVAAHTLQALIDRPHLWDMVAGRPDLVPGLVAEGVRWTSTPHHMVRQVRADCVLGRTELRRGDWVCAWLPSANRDEAVFDRPFDFDPRRSPNPHIGFGSGPHYCIGAAFSQRALNALFAELVTGFEQPVSTGPSVHLRSNWINGLVAMPIAARTRSGVAQTARARA
jgi:cytochrome P450